MNIKPCPFCGGVAKLRKGYSYNEREFYVFVKCSDCYAKSQAFKNPRHPAEDNWESENCKAAAAAWNNRVNED